jgi:cytochrome bd-type quinol oxidase subunit 2
MTTDGRPLRRLLRLARPMRGRLLLSVVAGAAATGCGVGLLAVSGFLLARASEHPNFTGLYPNVMVSSTNAAYNLTVHNTASGAYSLKVMTVVVVIFLPFVLAYQTWTYYVFRRRISKQEFRP